MSTTENALAVVSRDLATSRSALVLSVENLKRRVDWKGWVAANPWRAVLVAASVGVLLGSFTRRR